VQTNGGYQGGRCREFDINQISAFESGAAKGLRFDLKEKQWLKEMENGARGHLNKFVH
jgi:hypothetical protein